MTSAEPNTSNPVRAIFFDSPTDAFTAMNAAVQSDASTDQIRGALGRMPDAAKNAVLGRIGNAAAELLELDMADIFSAAWNKSAALRQAAEATAAAPDTEQLVRLATINTSVAHEPSVEVHVKEVSIATIPLHVQLDLEIHGLLAVVRRGRLIGIQAGTCDITGTLRIADTQVARRKKSLDLPFALRLKQGIPLLDDAARPQPPREAHSETP